MKKKPGVPPKPLAERFWPKVSRSETGCWEWTGFRMKSGYGQMLGLNRKAISAHRAAWIVTHGTEPPGDVDVCHACDNRGCVRPDHLFLGSRLDNMRDAKGKGRIAHGERAGHARLTTASVLAIRGSVESSERLAEGLGVSITTVRDARARRTWRHV